MWYFSGGDCIFGYDMVDTSKKTWKVSKVANDGTPLNLTQIQYVQERLPNIIEYKIAMAYDELCLSVSPVIGKCDDGITCRSWAVPRFLLAACLSTFANQSHLFCRLLF